uniref:Calx-beta domain-containing protein n=3 Tax=Lygus hesperus TaxID=30085 RepID=A0A0K8SFP5_LYGHE
MTGNHSRYLWGPPDVCPPALMLPILDEREWNMTFRTILYFVALLYFFLGVAIVTDIFMSSIEVITSKTKKLYLSKGGDKTKKQNGSYRADVAGLKEEEPEVMEVRVWNDTVANLTLMALGTSAPEILLSIIEIIGHNFQAGKLGPGTIVGSAAFNLLFITAICMVALPGNETRRIERFKVFVVTAVFSIFAYIWLFLTLNVFSPNVVEMWEAILTFLFFPILIFFAWSADQKWCGLRVLRPSKNKQQLELGPLREDEKALAERNLFKEGKLDKENLVKFVREVKKYPGLTDEDAALIAASKMVNAQPHSAVWYRIGAVRAMTAGRKTIPELDIRLKQVYDAMSDHERSETPAASPVAPDFEKNAVVEFHSAVVAVKENVGRFPVTVWRHGNVDNQVRVRVKTIDGTARKNDDYLPINEILTFEKGQREKQVVLSIVNDNKWEPNEEFFLRLSLIHTDKANLELGRISIMEVTIIDDDNPGIIAFEKRGLIVKESAGKVSLGVRRTQGTDGDVSIRWRTIDRSAISGRDYKGGSGELKFKHGEVREFIEIPIINDMQPEKDEHFEVELFSPTGGSRLGRINRCAVTITNDDDFYTIMDRLALMTNVNLDAIQVHRESWWQQIEESMLVNGGDTKNAKPIDYLMHFLSFFWKVLFSLIPPPTIMGGWLCFIVSLICIGLVTAVIGDIATIFGCLVGLDDTITAITLVALGTSLPDTFASRTATVGGSTADDAIGNINGSNSVNVFLGLGLPWLMATVHHYKEGTEFRMSSEGLGFSVLLFLVSAVIAMVVLTVRRNVAYFGKAEIGGPSVGKWGTFSLFVAVWIAYVTLTWLQIAGVIQYDI